MRTPYAGMTEDEMDQMIPDAGIQEAEERIAQQAAAARPKNSSGRQPQDSSDPNTATR